MSVILLFAFTVELVIFDCFDYRWCYFGCGFGIL